MVKRFLYIIFLFGLLSGGSFAQSEIKVKAYTDSVDFLLGDMIKFTIEVEREEGISVTPPLLVDSLKNLELQRMDRGALTKNGDIVSQKFIYYLMGFDSTDVTLGPFPVEYYATDSTNKKVVYTDPVYIVVRTLDVDPQGEIQDVKAPVTIPFNILIVLIIFAVILVLAIVGYFIYRYYKKKNQLAAGTVKQKVVIPPHKEALQLLRKLEDSKLWQQGEIKEYHSRITFIIRDYIEKRFSIPAMEVTSSELLGMLQHKNEFQSIYDKLSDFLSNADMVKFAKFEPMPSVNEEMMQQAYEFVNSTKPEEITPEVKNAD